MSFPRSALRVAAPIASFAWLSLHHLAVVAVVALAGCDGGRAAGAAPSGIGPDAVLLRLPAAGGIARAHRAGSDSVLWQSRDRVPAIGAILGFDDFLGVVLAQDRAARVVAVDLRLGTVETLGDERLQGTVVAEGSAVFGLDEQGRVLRLTPVATWNWPVPGGAFGLIPNPDGSLLLLSTRGGGTAVRRVIPPETRVVDSAAVPKPAYWRMVQSRPRYIVGWMPRVNGKRPGSSSIDTVGP